MAWSLAANFFVAMLAITNPPGKVSLWLEASADEDSGVRLRLAWLVTLTGIGTLLVFMLSGQAMLASFGIDLAAFRVGGGVVVMLIGIRMLDGKAIRLEAHERRADSPLAEARLRFREVVIPMAVPMIAGPGSITTAMIYGTRAEGPVEKAMLGVVLGIVGVIIFFTLLLGRRLQRWLGELPLNVFTRLFGLVIAAVAGQLILEGLADAFPALLSPDSPLVDDLGSRPQPA